MASIEERLDELQDEMSKTNINVSAVDRELFYNTLTISRAMTAKINEHFKQFEGFKVQLQELKEALIDISEHTKSMTNGGLKEALQSILPTIVASITSKEIEKNKSKTTLIVAVVGALGTLLGLALPYLFQNLAR